MKYLLAPSMLSADFTKLGADTQMINESMADWFHLDVMDGRFVPNISYGMLVIEAINRIATKPLDVHLMILEPDHYIEAFRNAGAEIITVHYEACTHLHRTIQLIKSTGAKAGVALNPATPVELLTDIIADLDLVLIMSVNPGFGGQKFIPQTYNKISRLRTLIESTNSKALIEIDGGVGANNIERLVMAGADVLVAGNAVFSTEDPKATIKQLKSYGRETVFV
ncbi:MAG: ribulose-phosphate 3-epimerase [Saprospiraceae bacterium]